MRKLLLFFVAFTLLCSFVSGIVENDPDTFNYYNNDNANISGSVIVDLVGNNNATIVGATTGATGILNEAISFDGTNDNLNIGNTDSHKWMHGAEDTSGFQFSVNLWYKIDNANPDELQYIIGTADLGTADVGFDIAYDDRSASGNTRELFFQIVRGVLGEANTVIVIHNDTFFPDDTDWHMITFTYDQSLSSNNLKAYVDGINTVVGAKTGQTPSTNPSTFDLNIGEAGGGTLDDFAGDIDEISIWNRTLNQSEITELNASGAPTSEQQYPFTPVDNVTQIYESLIPFTQVGSVKINKATFTTVSSINFEIDTVTEGYFTHSFEAVSTQDSNLTCRILLDGTPISGNLTRTMTSNVLGNLYLVSDEVNLTPGNYTESFECLRQTAGQISIDTNICVGHILSNGVNVTHTHENFSNVNVTSGFTNIQSFNFTTSSFNTSGNIEGDIVVNWNAIYGFDNWQTVTLKLEVAGVNCSEYPRGSNTKGDTGIVGGECVVHNVTANTTHQINVFGKGETALGGGVLSDITDFNIVTKEFVLGVDEIGNETLGGTLVNTSGLSLLKSITLSNDDHPNFDIFMFAGIPVISNESTNASFQFRVNGTSNFNGSIYQRGVSNVSGALVVQDVMINITTGTYTVSLYGACANSNCNLTGGDLVTYLAQDNDITAFANAFNLSVFDVFDNSTINNFSVQISDGTIFSTTSGSVLVFSDETLENLTITSNFNGGYFQNITLNHNTSLDSNVSLKQTIINWNCIEKVSGNDLTCTAPSESTEFNYNIINNPHTQSLNVSGYFENTQVFNVTPLQNETINVSFYSANLTINSSSDLGNVTSCVYNVTGITFPSFTESVNGTPLATIGLINGTYSVLADCDGFAFSTLNITINTTTHTLNFTLSTANSVNFTFYNEEFPSVLLTGINISLNLVRSGETINLTTNTGWIFQDDLTISTWEARYNAEGFDPRSFFFTVTNKSTQNIPLYLSNSSNTEQWVIRVADENDNEQINVTVRLQQQFIEQDGQFVTVEECRTNSEGRCDMFINEQADIVYRFIVLIDNEIVLTTVPSPIFVLVGGVRLMTLRVTLGSQFLDPDDQQLGLFSSMEYNNETGVVNYTWIDSQNAITQGCIVISRRTIPSMTYTDITETCFAGFSGTLTTNVTPHLTNNSELKILGVVDYNNNRQVLQTINIITFADGVGDRLSFLGEDELLLTAFGFLLIAGSTTLIPSLLVQALIDFGLLTILSALGINSLGLSFTIGFMILALFLSWSNRQNRGVD